MNNSGRKTKVQPRGIRNNNPLNIRIGNTWLGEVPHPTDSEFEQFVSPQYGYRAAFIILRRYIRRYGRNTITKIVSAWAPSNENNTQAYINTVSKRMGLDPDAMIDYDDADTMVSLVSAMAFVENGCVVPTDDIRKGYQLA